MNSPDSARARLSSRSFSSISFGLSDAKRYFATWFHPALGTLGTGTVFCLFRLQEHIIQTRMASSTEPPIPTASPIMTSRLWSDHHCDPPKGEDELSPPPEPPLVHWLPPFHWHVMESQHFASRSEQALFPQSHASPGSTIPFPQVPVLPVVLADLASTRQWVRTCPEPNLEQTAPIVQDENLVIPPRVVGFIMYPPSASQVEEDNGQQSLGDDMHVDDVQSWTAPRV